MKKLVCLILIAVCILPLAACGVAGDDAASLAPAPVMDINDLDKLAAYEDQFPGRTPEESAEIWAWAHQLVKEWNERYVVLKEQKAKETGASFTAIKKEKSEYSRIIYSALIPANATIGDPKKAKTTRTFATLTGWAESEWNGYTYEENEWGGFLIEELRQTATGFFYPKKLDGRWYLIDPDGYPTIMRAVHGVMPSYANNRDQLNTVLQKYGSTEKWSIAIGFELREMLGVYTTQASDLLTLVPEGFSFGTVGVPIIQAYGEALGIGFNAGSTYFDANIEYIQKNDARNEASQVMPVFDRGFAAFADKQAKETLAHFVGDPRVVLITTDNEIPIKYDMLDRYLKYSSPDWLEQKYPGGEKNALYHETYAVTLTWMRFMTGKNDVKQTDITDELRSLFLGFIYDRLMKVSSEAIKKYDPDHIYAGNRSLCGGEQADPDLSNSVLDREWLVRFSAQYLDAYALNWYSRWNPSSDECRRMTLWTGDLPIFITEFYSKTNDGTGREYGSTGAGFYVHTQEERGAMYENITLDFLEWKNIVGWSWYRYNHYSVGDDHKSACGILNDEGVYDPYLSASMALVNKNVYSIIKFLDHRQENWSAYFK